MNNLLSHLPVRALMVGTLIIMTFGCVVADGGYGYNDGGIGAAYYEQPYGVGYGGWGSGYNVAPYRNGGYRRGNVGKSHSYRSAPSSRSTPSIAGGRSGGGHSGGGRH